MIWKVRLSSSPRAIPKSWHYELPLHVEVKLNPDEPEVELEAVRIVVSTTEKLGIAWPKATAVVMRPLIHREAHFNLVFDVGRDRVQQIEDRRSGLGDLLFSCNLELVYRPVLELETPSASRRQRFLGPTENNNGYENLVFERSRDAWLADLIAWGWGETAVFEVSARRITENAPLRTGLEHLRAAERAFADGHWPAVLVEVRRALEAAAAVNAATTNRKVQFEQLLQSVLPKAEDNERRKSVGTLMTALAEMRNEAAHAGESPVLRDEAELALTTGISLFRYMGRKLDVRNAG